MKWAARGFAVLCCALTMLSAPARAACTNPAAAQGVMLYNTDLDIPQYCDGANWLRMAPKSSDVTDGLVGHWKLDESAGTTAADSSGNSFTGVFSGAPTWQPGAGKIAGALAFDGSDDLLYAGDHPLLSPGTGNFAVALWAKWNQAPAFGDTLVNDYGPGSTDSLSIAVSTLNRISCVYRDGAAQVTVLSPVDFLLGKSGVWIHYVCIRDGFNARLYADGVLIGSSGVGGLLDIDTVGNFPLTIGGLATGNSAPVTIDDVRVYNRLLSAGEITAIHNATVADYTTGLVGHWKLDEIGNTTTAADSSGNGNNGTLTAFPADPTTSWTDGPRDGALDFDGVDDYVNIPGLLGQPTNATLCAWVNLTARDASGADVINLGNYLGLRVDSSVGEGFFYTGSFWMHTDVNDWIAGEGWKHACYTYDDANDKQAVYSDGVQVGSSTYSQSIDWTGLSPDTNIGQHPYSDDYDFNGLIDDVRVYNRALSAEDIKALYLNSARYCENPDGVPGELQYNHDTRTPVYCDGANWVALAMPDPRPAGCPNIGDSCSDGSVYAGVSPDGSAPMYATPADAPGAYSWNNGVAIILATAMVDCTDVTPGTAASCQTGAANTAFLVGLSDVASPYAAAVYCDGLYAHGHQDWYLPAQDELDVLYDNRAAIGGFNTSGSAPAGFYWSSSEHGNNDARHERFSDGLQNDSNKWNAYSIRCVRKESAVAGLLTDPSLRAYWPLDEDGGTTANDMAGDNIGYTSGGVVLSSAGGKVAGAAEFDGADGNVIDVNTSFSGLTQVTYTAWIYPESYGGTSRGRILHKKDSTSSVRSSFFICDNAANGCADSLSLEAGWDGGLGRWNANSVITLSSWQHVAVTYDASDVSNVPKLYVNGQEKTVTVETAPLGTSPVADDNRLYIGNRSNGTRTFDGLIDDVRIYNRILTAAEIDAIYDAGALGLAARDCINPNGIEGAIIYNLDANAPQYCDGDQWVRLGGP